MSFYPVISFAGFTVPRLSPLNSLPTLLTTFSPIFFTLSTAFFDPFDSSDASAESAAPLACFYGESFCEAALEEAADWDP